MKHNDVKLINRILAGDENAFVRLVEKYQKQVHALAWRKIGDFHIAEEITQDTFLKVYQKLSTLKNPNQFAGWLYVIATNQCRAWLRKKRIETEPLEETDVEKIDEAYSRYVAEEQSKATVETQREVVKKLLAKLKESERTVLTLHYFGEMTVEEISRFLGVSASAIKLRLHRARQRLKKEEPMIREALSNFKLSPNLTDNIMQKVERIKPTAPSGSKPIIPWVLGASSIALIVLMLGLGSRHLAYFQQPYSLDTQSELAVELIDAPIVLNLEAKPDIRNQFGANADNQGNSDGDGQEANQTLFNKGDYTTWALPKGAKARLGKGTVREVAYSPDGNRLAVASGTGIWLYDAHIGKEINHLHGHTGSVLTVAFSPNGNTIASGCSDDTVMLWDADTKQLKHTLIGHKSIVTSVIFSSDGKTLVSASYDATVRLWDVETGKLKTVSDKMPSSIVGIVFSPGDDIIAGWGGMQKIYLLDVETGKQKDIIKTKQHVATVVFSPDGDKVVIGGGSNIQFLDMATGIHTGKLTGHLSNVTHLTFSPDGNMLASASLDRTLKLWNFNEEYHWYNNRFNAQTTLRKEQTKWHHVIFSPNGNTVAGVGWDGTVLCFDVATGEFKTTLSGHTSSVESIAFSNDGSIIASGNGNQVLIWDIDTQQQKSLFDTDGLRVKSIVFSPDGNTFATGNENNTVLVWDMLTGQHKTKIRIPRLDLSFTTDISAVTYSPDGNLIATSGGVDDDSVYLWDAETGELKATLEGHKDEKGWSRVNSIAFSPDGKTLASGHSRHDTIIHLWNVSTKQLKATLKGHMWNVFCVTFSPDGKTLASSGGGTGGDGEKTVRLWGNETGKQQDSLIGHTKPILSIAFSPKGNTIATGSMDKTVRIWDSATKQQIGLFEGHKASVMSVAYSPDGKTIASGSSDGTILLWDIPSMTNTNQYPR